VVVQSGAEPDVARLEQIHHAVGPREFHTCGRLIAAAADTGAGGVLLVCDATWTTLRAGLVAVDGTRLRLRRSIEVPGLGGPAFAAAVAPEAPATALARALAEEAHRIEAVTEAAASDAMYRDVRAVSVAGHDVSAGALMDAVAGYERRLRAELGPLRSADTVCTAVSGGFAGFGLLRGLFAQVTGREPVGGPGWVAAGAALLAQGRYGEPAAGQVRAVLPLHRRRLGRFEETLAGLPSAYGSFAVLDGRPCCSASAPPGRATYPSTVATPCGSRSTGRPAWPTCPVSRPVATRSGCACSATARPASFCSIPAAPCPSSFLRTTPFETRSRRDRSTRRAA
jgi:hypothetical protein